jgi:hypothetical protein
MSIERGRNCFDMRKHLVLFVLHSAVLSSSTKSLLQAKLVSFCSRGRGNL